MIKICCTHSVKYNGNYYKPSEPFLIDEKDLKDFEKSGATVLKESVTKSDIKKEEPKTETKQPEVKQENKAKK